MKVVILKENLNNGISVVGRAAGKNLILPILNNILISAEKNFLNLSATDLELGIKYWILTKIEKEGKITVPSKVLSAFINLLPNEKLTLELKNQTLYITSENHKTQIKGQTAEEFPIIPKIEDKNFIELSCALFCEGLSQVVDFSILNQTRPELSGVYLNFQKDKLQLAATDSFRLAEKNLYFERKNNKEFSFILPQKTAREIINILSEKKGKLRLYSSPNQVLFEYPMEETPHSQIEIVSRLIEGDYPDYQGIIPKKYQVRAVLAKNELLNQIKAASIFSGKSNEVKVRTDSKKGGIEIISQNPEYGENRSFLKGKIDQGEGSKETEVSFNYRFLVDGLSNIPSSKVVFELNGEEGPAVLKPEADSNYIYVVMPIKGS
jgi:DNA polymerase-3 subunit beta